MTKEEFIKMFSENSEGLDCGGPDCCNHPQIMKEEKQKTMKLDPPGIWDLKGTETTEFTKQLLRQERRLVCQEMIEYMKQYFSEIHRTSEEMQGQYDALEAAEEYLKTL